MATKANEWIRQADYDIDTAEFMFSGSRYFYTVFMCHLSLKKAIKGLYYERLKEVPPKSHNLVYLLNKIGLRPEEEMGRFLIKLNEANVVTRYPEDIEKLQRDYSQGIVKNILVKSKEALEWIKKQF